MCPPYLQHLPLLPHLEHARAEYVKSEQAGSANIALVVERQVTGCVGAPHFSKSASIFSVISLCSS